MNFPYYISVDPTFAKSIYMNARFLKPIPQASAFQPERRVGVQLDYAQLEMYLKILILIFSNS